MDHDARQRSAHLELWSLRPTEPLPCFLSARLGLLPAALCTAWDRQGPSRPLLVPFRANHSFQYLNLIRGQALFVVAAVVPEVHYCRLLIWPCPRTTARPIRVGLVTAVLQVVVLLFLTPSAVAPSAVEPTASLSVAPAEASTSH